MRKVEAGEFLKMAANVPVIDVRAPIEFNAGHIPGAKNIPLFNDEEREAIGIKYKKVGRTEAILEGLRLAGPAMSCKLENALKEAPNRKLLVHCWRGGMRSESMAWLFSIAGIQTTVLDGGYKAYRRYILEKLSERRNIIILGGMTGSGKTRILRHLGEAGRQVIDLEKLANHKGSAFGSLGQLPQPSTEQFANDLYNEWSRLSNNEPVWLEDESHNIGTVFLPEGFYRNMQVAKTIMLTMDIKTRMPRLLEEYSGYPPEMLRTSLLKISKRLGGDNTREALTCIDRGDIAGAIEISLKYYDKAYQFSTSRKNNNDITYIQTDTDDVEENARKILLSLRPL
ncbi:MAG TPA: tRNA 2-selenouridine(34) synthase MnmH [Bacteroidales bacterium]|nr:tRNA 2-selenouridine(34) synthase MnmH [Bacteroidales bacterium]